MLSTLSVGLPGGVNNGVSDLARALDYMRTHSRFSSVQLALGTWTFRGYLTPLAL